MSASWEGFRALLHEESRLLGDLNQAALALTDALVANDLQRINAAERRLEAARILHQEGKNRRSRMQRAGFGELTLEQVCAYAPGPMRRLFQGLARDLTIRGISLSITSSRNASALSAPNIGIFSLKRASIASGSRSNGSPHSCDSSSGWSAGLRSWPLMNSTTS